MSLPAGVKAVVAYEGAPTILIGGPVSKNPICCIRHYPEGGSMHNSGIGDNCILGPSDRRQQRHTRGQSYRRRDEFGLPESLPRRVLMAVSLASEPLDIFTDDDLGDITIVPPSPGPVRRRIFGSTLARFPGSSPAEPRVATPVHSSPFDGFGALHKVHWGDPALFRL